MIKRGSRYEYANMEFVQKSSDGDSLPALFYTFDKLNTLTYREYVWNSGDRLDLVASKLYNASALWWIILEHNPEISDPLNIPVGTKLRIPSVT